MTHTTAPYSGRVDRPRDPRWRSTTVPSLGIDAAATSVDGHNRDRNDDCFFLQQPLFVVTHGVGAQPGGAHAAEATLREAARCGGQIARLAHSGRGCTDAETASALLRVPARCQDVLRSHAAEAPTLSRMATTLTMALVGWPTAYVVWVGDSPCLLFRGNTLTRLTEEQTVAHALIEARPITEKQASRSPMRHVLANAVTAGPGDVQPLVARVRLRPHDTLILCTAGLSSALSGTQLARIVRNTASASEACSWIRMALKEATLEDDGTAVVVRILGPARRRASR